MKSEFILPIAPLVSVPSENENVRILRGVLNIFGDDGKGWCHGQLDNGHGQHCAWGALDISMGFKTNSGRSHDSAPHNLMERAARELGFDGIPHMSNSGFPNARRMVERAITLAQAESGGVRT